MDCGEVRIWGEWNAMDWSWRLFPQEGGPCCFAVHSCGDVSSPLLSCLGPAVCRGIDVVVGLSTTYVSVVCVSWTRGPTPCVSFGVGRVLMCSGKWDVLICASACHPVPEFKIQITTMFIFRF
jgi:hypothetical protein